MNKTLIGKNGYLFLINDSCEELKVHCNNLNKVSDLKLSRYQFNNFFIVVFPNKSLQLKQYLPDNYIVKYRPALEIYKKKFQEKMLDAYEILKNEDEVFYKTDTHMNLKGDYIVYCNFIKQINKLYKFNLVPKIITIEKKICILSELGLAIGDLTWPSNLGNQHLDDINDTYHFSNDIMPFYNSYKIQNNSNIRFLNYDLIDKTQELEINQEFLNWNIISKYIIYKNTNNNSCKILIFYDSFLTNTLPLYFDLFENIYFVKNVYDNNIINKIKPNYVFQFMVERHLF
jgi:hypothetical protein